MGRLNIKDTYGQALIAAAMQGNRELIELLVASGANVNAKNQIVDSKEYEYGDSTALTIAAGQDHKKCVETLVRLGADVNKANHQGFTPLIAAAENCRDNTDTVRFLIDSGADVNATDFVDETALIRSAQSCNTLKIKLLLELGADPHASGSFGRTTLMHAASWSHAEIIKILIEMGASVNVRKDDGVTPLMEASCMCGSSTIDLLIKSGADVNAINENGYDSLMFVLLGESKHYIDLDEFIPRKMSFSPYTLYGNYNKPEWHRFFNPMEFETKDELNCVNLLLSAGVDANHVTDSGWTAIMVAALKGQVDIIKSLLKSGANVNTTTYNGWCALISALIADHHNCAQYLIESGADVNIHVRSRRSKKNNFCVPRKSALGFAADIGNIDTLKLLLQSGVHKHGVFIYSTTKKDVKAILEAAGACSLDSNADFSLQNQCRKAIRRHLLETSPPVNLYYKITQLGLPSLMEHYLLYNVPALRR